MKTDSAIEMLVAGLVLDPNTRTPVVILKDIGGERVLPIWIGVAEATAIASALKNLEMSRPLTHDLIYDFISQVDVKVEQVMITELRESTYFAELALSQGEKAILLDSRPSDAIAIALRADASIYVAEEVLKQAGSVFESGIHIPDVEAEEGAPQKEGGQEGQEAQENSEGKFDFRSFDREEWDEILKNLDPEDFKYKQ